MIHRRCLPQRGKCRQHPVNIMPPIRFHSVLQRRTRPLLLAQRPYIAKQEKTAIAVLVVAVIVLALFITSTVSRQMQAAEDWAE